jgi:uncharacterized delta-60 repeat protein
MKPYLALIPILSALLATAQPNYLDPSFNKTGTRQLRGFHESVANSVAIRGDGTILVAGASSFNTYDFSLALFKPDGSLEPSFGQNGIVTTPIGNAYDGINAVALDGVGRIVVAGASDSSNQHYWTLARYSASGILDNTFATNGIYKTTALPGDAMDLKVQDDGKLLTCGWMTSGPGGVFGLLRLLPDGRPDSTFGMAGIVRLDLNGAWPQSLVLQPDGKILVSGFSWDTPPRRGAASLVRFQANGSIDSSFAMNGIITRDWSPDNDEGAVVLLQPDGKIILVGNARDIGVNYIVVERYLSNGQPDTSFGVGGQATNPATTDGWCHTAVLMPDGRIVVGGARRYGNGFFSLMALYGYLPDGTPDTGFGTHGVITTSIGNPSSEINELALQADGRLVAVGYAGDSLSSISQMAIARYLAMPSLGVPASPKSKIEFSAWPVPLSRQLHIAYTIQNAGAVKLELRDATGRVVQRWDEWKDASAGSHEHALSLSPDIAQGVYLLCLHTAECSSSVVVRK